VHQEQRPRKTEAGGQHSYEQARSANHDPASPSPTTLTGLRFYKFVVLLKLDHKFLVYSEKPFFQNPGIPADGND
jgi:hypothetical protein